MEMLSGTLWKTWIKIRGKCDLQILSVTNKNLLHMSETLFKLDFTLWYRNMIINLYITICDVNNASKINIVRRINVCKKIFTALVLVHSTVHDAIFDTFLTILVMVPVDAGFSGGLDPISLIRSTIVLHLTLGLYCQWR